MAKSKKTTKIPTPEEQYRDELYKAHYTLATALAELVRDRFNESLTSIEKATGIGMEPEKAGLFFSSFLGSKKGTPYLNNLQGLEGQYRAELMLAFQRHEDIPHTAKCRVCHGRGYTGLEVKYKTEGNGRFCRDEKGKAIVESSTKRICQCVWKALKPINLSQIRDNAKEIYLKLIHDQGQEKQGTEQVAVEARPATKKRSPKKPVEPSMEEEHVSHTPRKKRLPKSVE